MAGSLTKLNQQITRFDEAARRERLQSPEIIQRNKAVRYPMASGEITIFEVGAAATGHGIYKCFEPSLDSAAWSDVTGKDKFTPSASVWNVASAYLVGDYVYGTDKLYKCILDNTNQQPPNTTYWEGANAYDKEILNLLESDPIDTDYERGLALGDRLQCLSFDDKWVARPLIGPRIARTTEVAPEDYYVNCNLIGKDGKEITNGLGSNINVHINIAGSGFLDAALPELQSNEDIVVYHENGRWWCNTTFSAAIKCPC